MTSAIGTGDAGRMRFSIWPSNSSTPFAEVARIAELAEGLGWDGVWYADHFMPNAATPGDEAPVLEVGAVVAGLAARVPRLRIGTLVCSTTYRHPAVLANLAATVDQISDGRFVLGLGAGWQVNEHEQYGIELPGVRERIDRFEEATRIIRSLLTEPRTSFSGKHFQFSDAVCEPKGAPGGEATGVVRRPPIMIGAGGEKRMLPLVAELADEWNCWGLPDVIARKNAIIDASCERLGRDPREIARSAAALVTITATDEEGEALMAAPNPPRIAGTPARLVELVEAYRAAGLDELIVPASSLGRGEALAGSMELFTREVIAAFR